MTFNNFTMSVIRQWGNLWSVSNTTMNTCTMFVDCS